MAIVYQQPQLEPDRRGLALGQINNAFGLAAGIAGMQNQRHLGSALFGTPGRIDAGVGALDINKVQGPGYVGPKAGLFSGGSWGDLNKQQRGAVANMFTGGGGGSSPMMQAALARMLMAGR